MCDLTLIRETKIDRVLPPPDDRQDDGLEASGVLVRDGLFLLVFDNLNRVARIGSTLSRGDQSDWTNELDDTAGFEDITLNTRQERYYLLIEALPHGEDTFRAAIVECDLAFNRLERHSLPFDFESDNKGFEGLAYLHRAGRDYVFALCEGNSCRGGREGRTPGSGRIQVFRRDPAAWTHVGTLNVPHTVQFADFAALDIRDGTVAVLSQESSSLWLGTLGESTWEFVDEGVVLLLPRDEEDEAIYCNAEGVAWIALNQVVIVSDRKKKDSPKRCGKQDESIHLFIVPPPNGYGAR